MSRLAETAAGIIAILAGAYLINTQAAAADSLFNPLLHGIGAYIVARGIWMLATAGRQAATVDRLDKLVQLAAIKHAREDSGEPPV